MDNAPLFPAGLHPVDESQLDNHFLRTFVDSETRPALIRGLRAFVAGLRVAGVPFELWLDGSFCTHKVNPNDVDLVVFANEDVINRLDPAVQSHLAGLFDRESSKRKFGCDVLFCPAGNLELRSYWRGWFGFDRREQPKGIACLTVAS